MTRSRVVLYSLLGFFAPIAIAVLASPYLFPETTNSGYERARLENIEPDRADTAPLREEPAESEAPFTIIPSDPALDPAPDKSFVLNLLVRFNRLPEAGKRQRIIFKYQIKKPPYEGWALAVNHLPTSVRPELYWRDAKGKGGWHTFEEVRFDVGSWYQFTAVVSPDGFLSLHLQELEPGAVREVEGGQPTSPIQFVAAPERVRFLGGYDVSEIGLPKSDDQLFARARARGKDDFPADVAEVFLARGPALPKEPARLRRLLAGGSQALMEYLGAENVSLLLDSNGEDRSKFHRPLETGKAPGGKSRPRA